MRLAGVQNTYPPHHLHTIAFERDVVAERLETSRALSTRIAVAPMRLNAVLNHVCTSA